MQVVQCIMWCSVYPTNPLPPFPGSSSLLRRCVGPCFRLTRSLSPCPPTARRTWSSTGYSTLSRAQRDSSTVSGHCVYSFTPHYQAHMSVVIQNAYRCWYVKVSIHSLIPNIIDPYCMYPLNPSREIMNVLFCVYINPS